jgi:XTP/dITP diphosphohydrolase
VWDKVMEELQELRDEVESNAPDDRIEDEFGDLLFALTNYARYIGINPDDALERTNRKFQRRFQFIETESQKDGKSIEEMNLEEMDVYWNKAKKLE